MTLTCVIDVWISFLACTSCPCPIEIALQSADTGMQLACLTWIYFFWLTWKNLKHWVLPSSRFLASASIWSVGSEPMDRKQMRGVRVSLSSHVAWRLRMTGSANLVPMALRTYFLAWAKVLSGHHDLSKKNTINIFTRRGELCGSTYLSYVFVNSTWWAAAYWRRLESCIHPGCYLLLGRQGWARLSMVSHYWTPWKNVFICSHGVR